MSCIIILQKGKADYLDCVLEQAKRWNPTYDIILLGDKTNKKEKNCIWYDYKDYVRSAQDILVKNYKHFSTNPAEYELICIARWFIISEFMERNGVKRAFITDSDVLLYCNIEDEYRRNWRNYRCTLTHNISAGISFMNERDVLKEYCDFVVGCYSGKEKFWFDKAKSHYDCLQQNKRSGGVNDMTFWGFLRYLNPPGDFGETMSIVTGSTFDHNMNVSYGYRMSNGVKEFRFTEGLKGYVPSCIHEKRKEEIKFNCIHFQGAHRKRLIRNYYKMGK